MLTREELDVFAALARVLVRIDGKFSRAEAEAIEHVATQILGLPPSEGPYRESATGPERADATLVWELIERAERADDAAVQRAARGVTRAEARELIYEALHAIAASDAISREESSLLEWLEREWDITRSQG
jgi:hypothetical protein